MTQKTRRSLVAIQILIGFFTLLMFVAGLFAVRAAGKSEALLKKSSELNFDEKMRPSIGKPYTEERHYKLLELIQNSDQVAISSNEALMGASTVMYQLGGAVALCSLASIFLLFKRADTTPGNDI